MNCPNCTAEMTNMMLADRVGGPVEIDVCANCHAFWFDKYESLKLSAGSTLRLMKFIGESSTAGKAPFSETMSCPRCRAQLRVTHDMQRSTRFSYFRCPNDHGRFIRFFEFLREKDFIRPLSAEQVDQLRQSVQTVNCSNCGAPIDLTKSSACAHCGSALSMLDMKQSEKLLKELKEAAEPKPIDPDLPLKLAWAKHEAELKIGRQPNADLWGDLNAASGLVEDGLNAVARWLSKSKLL
jgi:Zn-finger nucleic acid-binding protein